MWMDGGGRLDEGEIWGWGMGVVVGVGYEGMGGIWGWGMGVVVGVGYEGVGGICS